MPCRHVTDVHHASGIIQKMEIRINRDIEAKEFKNLIRVSTEAPGIDEVCGYRRVIPTNKEDADNKTGTGK